MTVKDLINLSQEYDFFSIINSQTQMWKRIGSINELPNDIQALNIDYFTYSFTEGHKEEGLAIFVKEEQK